MNSLALNLNTTLTNTLNFNEELLENYKKHLQVSNASQETYLNGAKHFINFANERNITSELVLDYRTHLINNYKATAINSYIVSLKQFFNFLEGLGFPNYAKELRGVRTSKKHKRDSLTIEQVKTIFNNTNSNTEEQARARALIKLLIGTGLRTIEVVNANISDMQTIGNERVLYIQGKGFNNAKENLSDYVILKPSVINAIQDYLRYRPGAKDSEPLFTSVSDRNKGERLTTRTIRNIVKNLYKQNGIISERITTHSTRHTAITLSLVNGASIQEAQQLARHTNINTTMIYAHNIDRLNNNAESKLEELLESIEQERGK